MKRSKLVIAFLISSIMRVMPLSVEARPTLEENIPPVIWKNPGDIRSRDLRYGPGSPALAPLAPFTFVREKPGGSSPKFDVKDARQVTWRVKLGPEAQAETVATRLVWSVGYFAEETYYFKEVRIENLPRLSRVEPYVKGQGVVLGARFKLRRKDIQRGDHWHWNKNPFVGTRELDGLKVLMLLLNNFDARHENNRVLITRDPRRKQLEARYVVTDIGATLGRARGIGGGPSKNNLGDFLSSKFIVGIKDGIVQFDYHTQPGGLGLFLVFYPPYYVGEAGREKIMQGIPVAHARWIGALLSRLTDKQLRDTFRVAGYDEAATDAYVKSLRWRIRALAYL